MLLFRKGLVWLFFATIAYVPPVVSGVNFVYPSLHLIVTLPSQVLISLDLNGRLFLPIQTVDYYEKLIKSNSA
jgi:hypothetical protein